MKSRMEETVSHPTPREIGDYRFIYVTLQQDEDFLWETDGVEVKHCMAVGQDIQHE